MTLGASILGGITLATLLAALALALHGPEAGAPAAARGRTPAPAAGATPVELFQPRRPEDYVAIAARPLFLATRRLPEAPAAPAPVAATPAPPPAPPKLMLTGTVHNAGQWLAIVKKDRNEAEKLVRVGDRLDGWLVSDITEAALVLGHPPRDVRIPLDLNEQHSVRTGNSKR